MEITKNIQLVKLNGFVFKNEKGQMVGYNKSAYGFLVNNKFVAKDCKSAGGSSLPMAYDRKVANSILQCGLVVEEIAYCEPIKM